MRIVRAVAQGVTIVAIGLILTEIAFRVLHRISPIFIFPVASYNQLRPKPFIETYGFTHNSQGFKDVEYEPQKPAGSYRIVAIGDSFAYGVVPYEHNFLTLLEEDLDRSHGPVEVLNMGIPSVSVPDYFSILVHEGLRYDPDMVLLCFYIGNDLKILWEEQPKSYLVAFFNYLFRVMPEYSNWTSKAPGYDDSAPTFSDKGHLQALRNRIFQFRVEQPEFVPTFPKVALYLERMRQLCESQGVELRLAILPDELQVNPAVQAKILDALDDLDAGDVDFTLPNAWLRDELDRQSIPYVDLLDAFTAEAATATVYKPRDTHWNILGNRIAARELYRDLAQSGILPAKSPAGPP